jgi:hypothetical protein
METAIAAAVSAPEPARLARCTQTLKSQPNYVPAAAVDRFVVVDWMARVCQARVTQ